MKPSDARRICVTGVSRGLGRVLVDGFIARGHVVFGTARSKMSIDELGRKHPSPHAFTALDVRDGQAVCAWAEQVIATGGPPDLLVNCAALMNRNAVLWEVPVEEFDAVIDVNIKGTANCVRSFAPAMVARQRGVIVNFSSGWGRSVSPEVAPYCASKWAIEGLTQALAEELPRGMAAVPLNPGIINTEMLQSCFGASAASYPDAQQWAQRAVPYILSLGPKDNGQPRSVPGG